jgi:hypothetical protein
VGGTIWNRCSGVLCVPQSGTTSCGGFAPFRLFIDVDEDRGPCVATKSGQSSPDAAGLAFWMVAQRHTASRSSLVGHNGVAVAFQHNGGEPLLIEYLLRTSKPINAMGRAMEQVASQASCSETDRGRITRKSVNVGIIETPTFGDWSVATKDQIFGNGGIPNLGTSSYGSRASFLQWRTRTLEVLN